MGNSGNNNITFFNRCNSKIRSSQKASAMIAMLAPDKGPLLLLKVNAASVARFLVGVTKKL